MSGNIELFHVIWFPFAAAFLCYLAGKRHKIVRDRLLVMSVVLEMGLMLDDDGTFFTGLFSALSESEPLLLFLPADPWGNYGGIFIGGSVYDVSVL